MANNSYEIPIYLKVSEQGSGASGGEGEFLPMQSDDGVDKNQKVAAEKSKSWANPVKAIAAHMVKRVASTALCNYGNVFGDYVAQQNIQATIGEATALGGAVAIGAVGIALYVTDKGLQAYNYIAQIKRSEAESAFKQQRVYASNRRS